MVTAMCVCVVLVEVYQVPSIVGVYCCTFYTLIQASHTLTTQSALMIFLKSEAYYQIPYKNEKGVNMTPKGKTFAA